MADVSFFILDKQNSTGKKTDETVEKACHCEEAKRADVAIRS